MSFIVTARKWRPQKFNDVVGQEHITTTLKNAIKSGRIAHAFLFTGPRGVGKTTSARILARTLNCLNPIDFEACDVCENCLAIQNNQFMDIIEIDGASNRGIDEIKNLRESVKYAPASGKYKVYIIDEVHMLTKESFNAFLKTLEEPPEHTIFIFATTDVHKVPLTIISRCQRFDFRRIQLDTIKELLSKIAVAENINIDDTTLTLIAKKADGALRDAESFFDQVVSFCGNDVDSSTVTKMLNLIDEEAFFTLSDAILQKNFNSVFEISNKIYENGWNSVDFMEGLIEHFRNILFVVITENNSLIESANVYKQRYLSYVNSFSKGDLLRILNFLNKTNQEFKISQNFKVKLEVALFHLIGMERSATISEIISKVDSFEAVDDKKKVDEKFEFKKVIPVEQKAEKKAYKEVIETPQEEKKTLNEDEVSIRDNWNKFIDYIASNSFFYQDIIKTAELNEVKSNNIYLTITFSEDNSSLPNLQDVLKTASNEIFKKTYNFDLNKRIVQTAASSKNNEVKDEIEQYIISEMKGKKL